MFTLVLADTPHSNGGTRSDGNGSTPEVGSITVTETTERRKTNPTVIDLLKPEDTELMLLGEDAIKPRGTSGGLALALSHGSQAWQLANRCPSGLPNHRYCPSEPLMM